jgi:hypothetical protein
MFGRTKKRIFMGSDREEKIEEIVMVMDPPSFLLLEILHSPKRRNLFSSDSLALDLSWISLQV